MWDKVDFNTKLLLDVNNLTLIQETKHSQAFSVVRIFTPPTNLSIGDTDKPLIHQLVPGWVPGLTLHDVALSCFIGQGDGRHLTEEGKCELFLTDEQDSSVV